MSGKENGQESRQKILDAALDVFYEAGFDGARMDRIAKRAGVNQALIYYYFQSKKGLFAELIDANIREMILEKKKAVGEKDIYDLDIYDADVIRKVVDQVMAALKKREKIFSIVLGEIFRNPSRQADPKIFEAFLPSIQESRRWMSSLGICQMDIDRGVIAAVFFGSLPMITYATLGEKLADHYGLDKENLREIFTELLYHFSEDYVGFLKDRTGSKFSPD